MEKAQDMRLPLIVFAALLLASCSWFGSSPVEKQFPGGEPGDFEEHDRRMAEAGEFKPAPLPEKEVSIPEDRRESRGLRMNASLAAPRVKAGTPFRVTCQVANTSNNQETITYTDNQRFDVVVFADREQNKVVYIWSEGRFFAQMFAERMLSGGTNLTEILEVPTVGDPVSEELLPRGLSRPLTPGTYYLWATHAGTPYLAVGPLEVVVEP